MSPANAFIRGGRYLAMLATLLVPLASPGQADKSGAKKHLQDLAALYASLAITDVEMPSGALQAADAFRPTFKITNQTDRTLAVPLKAGLPVDKACILGQSMWTVRRVGGTMAKGEVPRIFMGHNGPVLAETVEPKAVMEIPPPSEGQTIRWMELQAGDYEVTLDFGIPNGPKVKPVVRKFRVENNASAADMAKDKAEAMNSSRQSFGDFAHNIFASTEPGELTLSNLKLKAGAPLQAVYVIKKAAGQKIPSPSAQNKQYALGYAFRLHKPAGPKARPPLWSKELLLNWDSIAVLREKGSFSMILPLETNGLAPGAYEVSVEVLHVESAGNAPRPQKLRFTVVK